MIAGPKNDDIADAQLFDGNLFISPIERAPGFFWRKLEQRFERFGSRGGDPRFEPMTETYQADDRGCFHEIEVPGAAGKKPDDAVKISGRGADSDQGVHV